MVRHNKIYPIFLKGKQTNRSKTFFQGIRYYLHMGKSKKIKKDNNNFKKYIFIDVGRI